MQLSFREKQQFFGNLSGLLGSGATFPQVVGTLARGGDKLARFAAGLGTDFSAAVARFDALDREVLLAGEQGGKLPEAAADLGAYYGELAEARARVLRLSAYPIFVLHLAALLLAVPGAILSGSGAAFFSTVAVFLGPLYVAALLLGLGIRVLRSAAATSVAVDRALRALPFLRGLFIEPAVARFCMVMAMGVGADGRILGNLDRAGRASRSAMVAACATEAERRIRNGEGLAEALAGRAFPSEAIRAFHVAETSGRLSAGFRDCAALFRARFFVRLETLSIWIPRLLYVIVCLVVALGIIGLALRVGSEYSQILDVP